MTELRAGVVMEHASPIPPPGFDDLEVDQQIEYVQALWDRIAAQETAVPVPDWHREIADERLADLDAHQMRVDRGTR